MALITIRDNSDNVNPVSTFVQARKALAAVDFDVFSWGNIISWDHMIAERVTWCRIGHGQNERCIVNSHLALVTSNDWFS